MNDKQQVPCFECDFGFYEEVFKDYESEEQDGTFITVPNVKHMICDKCGDTCFDEKASNAIDDYLDEHLTRRNKTMIKTNEQPEPAHDCAEIIAREMYAVERAAENNQDYPDWDNSRPRMRAAYVAAVKALPGILLAHAGDDLKAWLAAQIGTSSPWRSALGYISAAAVGAAVLWATSFLVSCAPAMTPEQVRQIDAAHAIMHRVTGTDCTLCAPVVTISNEK